MSSRKPTQPTTRHSRRGRTGRERPDVEADVDQGGPRLQAATDCAAFAVVAHQHQPPPQQQDEVHRTAPRHGEGGQHSRRTAALRHTAGVGPRPGPAPAAARPAPPAPHDTLPLQQQQDGRRGRMSCRQQPAPPQRDAAKMPRISIGPEPVLASHAPSPPASGNHCPAREG
jgi:hypothetical protein